MTTVSERAEGVFKNLGLKTLSVAASGRYQRSEEVRSGVTYWSTSSDRHRTDTLGVQFSGDGLALCKLLSDKFEQHDFEVRNPGTDRVTFCKSVARKPDGRIDVPGLQSIKSEIDAILGSRVDVTIRNIGAVDFIDFMRASPLAGVELEIPERRVDERGDI